MNLRGGMAEVRQNLRKIMQYPLKIIKDSRFLVPESHIYPPLPYRAKVPSSPAATYSCHIKYLLRSSKVL